MLRVFPFELVRVQAAGPGKFAVEVLAEFLALLFVQLVRHWRGDETRRHAVRRHAAQQKGIGLDMPDYEKQQIRYYQNYFRPYNVYDFSREAGGTDIEPLGKLGVPMAGLLPDSQRYFDVHHTNNDVFEHVNHRELKLGAVTMAQLIYLVSEHGLK